MKPKEIFGLAVRLLGLAFLYHGIQVLPSALGQMIGSFPHVIAPGAEQDLNVIGFLTGVLMAGWPLAVAYWLVTGAPQLMRIAYPETSARSTEESQNQGALNRADS